MHITARRMTQQVTPHFSFYLQDLCLSLLIWCFTINHPLDLVPIQNMLGSRNNTLEAYKIASEPAQLNTQRGKKQYHKKVRYIVLIKNLFFQRSWITTSYAWRQSACSKPEWAGQTRKTEVIMGKPGTRSYGTEGEWYASLRGPTRIGDQAIQSTATAKIL